MARLGDVCIFFSGTGFPNTFQGKKSGEYPFYKVGDISKNVLLGNRELLVCDNYVDDIIVKEIRGSLIPPKTIVFAKIGEALKLNRRAITLCNCLVDNNVMGLQPDNNILDTLYFYYFMCSLDLQYYCESTAVPSVRKTRIAEIEIPIPTIEEQRKIAAVLDKVSDLIAKRRQQLEKLDLLEKARFVEMFGDPVSNPRQWETQSVSNVCKDIYGGGTPSKSHPEYFEGGIPWVSPKDMKSNIITDSIDHITEEAVKNSSAKIVPKDAVLMVIRSGILKHTLPVAIAAVELTVNQDMKVFIAGQNVTSKFLMYYFKAIEMDVLSGVRGVTADNIDFKEFQKRLVIVPPIELQQLFSGFVERTEKTKTNIKESLTKLETLKKALMQKYFK